jgi:flagellar biosynthetic protein FliO
MGWVLFQTMLSLAAVLALMVGVVYAMKRWLFGTQTNQQSSIPIDVLGYRVLQPKRSVYVVKVLGKTIVVGVSEAGMQTLCEIDEDAVAQQTEMMKSGSQEMSSSFLSYLKDNLGIVRSKAGSKLPRSKNGTGK